MNTESFAVPAPMRNRVQIIDTPSPAEILAVFETDGIPQNVTVTDRALNDRLVAASDEDRPAVEAEIFASAEALLDPTSPEPAVKKRPLRKRRA